MTADDGESEILLATVGPVRVGNGAWRQQQIDVYGELLGAAHRLADQISAMDEDLRRFLVALADTAAVRWRDADQGIWEVRGEPRHFLYSKVMCWVALDRAVALADRLGAEDRVDAWKRAQDEALALAGRTQQAREVFGHTARYINDVGLLAEEVDPATGELLGNFPQAFSHIGLVNAAYAIAEAERAATR